MKTTKWVSLCLLLLTVAMLFSACGQPTVGFKKALDGDKFAPTAAPTAGNTVDALQGATFISSIDSLAHFTKGEEGATLTHIVYNIETNAVVYTGASDPNTTVEVSLNPMDYGTVISVYTAAANTFSEQKPHRAIYSEAGALIAEADTFYSPRICCDLICFADKVYRMEEDGTVTFAFERSPLAKLPAITGRLGKLYFAPDLSSNWQGIQFYDHELNYVSTFKIPSYAVNVQCAFLSGDKVLVQYAVTEPDDAKDYTFIGTGSRGSLVALTVGTKYTLKTLLYTPKDDKIKEIDFDCVIINATSCVSDKDEWNDMALSDKYDAMLTAYPIIDKQLNITTGARQNYLVSKNGKISAFKIKALGDDPISVCYPIAEDLWSVSTDYARYLINKKGKIVADISNAAYRGGYLLAEGKLYNLDQELVLDYNAADLKLVNSFSGGCTLFKNSDDELISFVNGTQTTLIAKDSQRMLCKDNEIGYFIIVDYSNSAALRYEIYGGDGTKLLDLTGLGDAAVFDLVTTGKNGELLISCKNEGAITYYRLA